MQSLVMEISMDLERCLMNNNPPRYQIIIGSPVDYEELVAYIVLDGDHVALVSQEDGSDSLKIEFFEEPNIRVVDYEIFLSALKEAKRLLITPAS